ncbi:MAG TPA: response regulator [Burkholderiaceae bacterium]|nr:response regulator [Burkholderiaceae bacterium]
MKTILVVEDIELNRDLVTQLLEDDYRLVYASDGLAALAVAESAQPDLVLMDLSLPVLDGWKATQRLKSDPRHAANPVVVRSAHAMRGAAGARALLVAAHRVRRRLPDQAARRGPAVRLSRPPSS